MASTPVQKTMGRSSWRAASHSFDVDIQEVMIGRDLNWRDRQTFGGDLRAMMDEIEIRRAIASDAPLISELVTNTIRISNSADYPASVIERVIGNFSADAILKLMDSRNVWIALQGGEPVGTASLDGDTVRTVFVSPTAQRRGIGRRVMQTVEAAAFANGIKALQVPASLTARNFYARLGYSEVREVLFGEELTVVMEKQID
ncbi:GNAT family N-acetyltransferase [Rhizobium laguerreae]|uniref:GNAT family N-acetyltransferase n=1 Tax=Rhizobium laguerreae TaxID=1076926 RepID=UPI0028C3E987|nr:GNAT family N-acetyltransferase [Rhizobium laguerreae]